MIVGEGFYAWNPNLIQAKDPDTRRYFGNAIGNVPLEDQLKIVDDEGTLQKEELLRTASEQSSAIGILAEKYVTLWQIADEVVKALTGEDPEPRSSYDPNELEAMMDAWIAEQEAASTDIPDSETPETNDPASATVPFDDDPYIWSPNWIQIRNPETRGYFGNAIGNLSLEEQLQIVIDAGIRQKTEIMATSEAEKKEISDASEKFRHTNQINKDAMKEIVSFFGGVFILDSSALDSMPIG